MVVGIFLVVFRFWWAAQDIEELLFRNSAFALTDFKAVIQIMQILERKVELCKVIQPSLERA